MAKYKASTLFNNLVIALLVMYVFYALSNLFFIPNCVSAVSKASVFSYIGMRRQKVQANHGVVNIILVGEKSILNDDQLNAIKFLPVIILLIFCAFTADIKRLFLQLTTLPQGRYDYLSFCTLRI